MNKIKIIILIIIILIISISLIILSRNGSRTEEIQREENVLAKIHVFGIDILRAIQYSRAKRPIEGAQEIIEQVIEALTRMSRKAVS